MTFAVGLSCYGVLPLEAGMAKGEFLGRMRNTQPRMPAKKSGSTFLNGSSQSASAREPRPAKQCW